MPEITRTIKLHLIAADEDIHDFRELTSSYAKACTEISKYVFEHGFVLNFMSLQKALYQDIRARFCLKSQMTISSLKTVTARYKTVQEQLARHPYRCKADGADPVVIPRTLRWLQKPVVFHRPQADLVRGRDYSFVHDKASMEELLSINTLSGRRTVHFHRPQCFEAYFDGSWKFGTAKLVELKGEWYLHIPATKNLPDTFDEHRSKHVVGIDRGLRFLTTVYDDRGDTFFVSGKEVMAKRDKFAAVRAELQAKGTKSAKRALKRISGRENRFMSDVNHRISKTLVDTYGSDTLFVMEDLTNVSFDEANLSENRKQNNSLRSWAFYQLEQYLSYKAVSSGSFSAQTGRANGQRG